MPTLAQEEIQHRPTANDKARTSVEKPGLKADGNGLDVHLSANRAQGGLIRPGPDQTRLMQAALPAYEELAQAKL